MMLDVHDMVKPASMPMKAPQASCVGLAHEDLIPSDWKDQQKYREAGRIAVLAEYQDRGRAFKGDQLT